MYLSDITWIYDATKDPHVFNSPYMCVPTFFVKTNDRDTIYGCSFARILVPIPIAYSLGSSRLVPRMDKSFRYVLVIQSLSNPQLRDYVLLVYPTYGELRDWQVIQIAHSIIVSKLESK